ncbi:MAG TPA: hypothetical protein VFR27_04295 [Mycobacterium sp.]|nr:hypothetical protein [Mycobacterium sp.]
MKSLVAAVAAIGAAAAVGTAAASLNPSDSVSARVGLTVFDAPLAPAADIPSTDQLTGVLNGLADPGVPFANKADLVEGGVAGAEASMADRKLQKAARKGELPLAFGVTNIEPAGPGAATADVTVSGPKLQPVTQNVTFVDQGGWKLSRASAIALLQAA